MQKFKNSFCFFTFRKEIKVLRKNFCVQIMVDILFYQGKQIFHCALLIPYFLTSSQVRAEAVFITMTCVAVLHMVWVGYGSEATCHISHSIVSVKRFKVMMFLVLFFYFSLCSYNASIYFSNVYFVLHVYLLISVFDEPLI